MKIVATVPTITPTVSAKMKPRMVSPPKKKIASSVTSVVPEVLIVRDSVELMALFTFSLRLRLGYMPRYSRIRSKTTTVSLMA